MIVDAKSGPLSSHKINAAYEYLCVCQTCKTPFVSQSTYANKEEPVCLQCGAKKVKIVCELSEEKKIV